jgi:hypothetical protein
VADFATSVTDTTALSTALVRTIAMKITPSAALVDAKWTDGRETLRSLGPEWSGLDVLRLDPEDACCNYAGNTGCTLEIESREVAKAWYGRVLAPLLANPLFRGDGKNDDGNNSGDGSDGNSSSSNNDVTRAVLIDALPAWFALTGEGGGEGVDRAVVDALLRHVQTAVVPVEDKVGVKASVHKAFQW